MVYWYGKRLANLLSILEFLYLDDWPLTPLYQLHLPLSLSQYQLGTINPSTNIRVCLYMLCHIVFFDTCSNVY